MHAFSCQLTFRKIRTEQICLNCKSFREYNYISKKVLHFVLFLAMIENASLELSTSLPQTVIVCLTDHGNHAGWNIKMASELLYKVESEDNCSLHSNKHNETIISRTEIITQKILKYIN